MRALIAFEHHGRQLVEGESFECSPIEAAAYKYKHKAQFENTTAKPKRGQYRRRDLRAEP